MKILNNRPHNKQVDTLETKRKKKTQVLERRKDPKGGGKDTRKFSKNSSKTGPGGPQEKKLGTQNEPSVRAGPKKKK